MYGLSQLKAVLHVTEEKVPCPIVGCKLMVDRQSDACRRLEPFFCPDHGIYISPSTFQYENPAANILWGDYDRLVKHMKFRRESRIARDNSKDAATWNVFRFLENHNLLLPFLLNLTNVPLRDPTSVFWSYDREQGDMWEPLKKARGVLGVEPDVGIHPDLVVLTDKALFFVKTMLTQGSNNWPNQASAPVCCTECHAKEAGEWFANVVKVRTTPGADFRHIAFAEKKCQLLWFWLLGSWLAKEAGRAFCLVSLVRDHSEYDIEKSFGSYLRQNEQRAFRRVTWEEIHQFVAEAAPDGADRNKMLKYFQEKTVGYDANGYVQQAFKVVEEWL